MRRTLRKWLVSFIFCVVVLLAAWILSPPYPKVPPPPEVNANNLSKPCIDLSKCLSVVLFCDFSVLLSLERAVPASTIGEVILICTVDEIETFASILAPNSAPTRIKFITQVEDPRADFSLLAAAFHASYETVLLLDSNSLLDRCDSGWLKDATTLVRKEPLLPAGPCGCDITAEGLIQPPLNLSGPVSFVKPPFVANRAAINDASNGMSANAPIWMALGRQLSSGNDAKAGGMLTLPEMPKALTTCSQCAGAIPPSSIKARSANTAQVWFILAAENEMQEAQKLYCRLAEYGHSISTFVVQETRSSDSIKRVNLGDCYASYYPLYRTHHGRTFPDLAFLSSFLHKEPPDVIIASNPASVNNYMIVYHDKTTTPPIEVVLTPHELRYSAWMASLTLDEWKRWDDVRIDLAVVTNDRPVSLTRLLTSLNDALYFGHFNINLIINMEQTADTETRAIAQNYDWKHGKLIARHRVVKGGLIPAIVESWYPSTDDNYGLILEDDIELSPLFFAWAKMTILRYRYGSPSLRMPRVYGISFYSPKNVELRMEGRRPWSAQEIIRAAGHSSPNSPYLSATPCSWGAVYFPEHWRDFHDYLPHRLLEISRPLTDQIVPEVRSNRWQRSWKRFFIEFAWLCGYVMLYPNYDDFLSLSTNHVEIGSHVTDLSVKAKKKAQFVVPLMPLNDHGMSLLQLPNEELPNLDDLPVVDLLGSLTSMEILQSQGQDQRFILTDAKLSCRV